MLNLKHTKIILFILIAFSWNNLSSAEMFVLNKCWTPIEKNAYGDKVKNFKEFKKNKKIEDYIIKIDTEKMTIVKRYVLPGDYYDPFDPRLNLMSFDILDISNNKVVGKNEGYLSFKNPGGYLLIIVDLKNKKAGTWLSEESPNLIDYHISCKAYKEDILNLKSILKMLN